MATEYISREAVKNAIHRDLDMQDLYLPIEFIELLDDIPAADVRSVVRGWWSRIDYEPYGHDYKCSACGWKNDMRTNFCPNCGANMRKKS